nr:MAG TPA: hypothetical protein [Caudoviricetes sp.]
MFLIISLLSIRLSVVIIYYPMAIVKSFLLLFVGFILLLFVVK